MAAEEGLEIRDRPCLGAAHPGALVAACTRHRPPTIRTVLLVKSTTGATGLSAAGVHPRIYTRPRGRSSRCRLPERLLPGRRAARGRGRPDRGADQRAARLLRPRRRHPGLASPRPRLLRRRPGGSGGLGRDRSSLDLAGPLCSGDSGAELYPGLDREKLDYLLDKGMDRRSQGYSAFHRSGLGELLHEHRVDRVFVAGLTTEYCVKNTVLDARGLGSTSSSSRTRFGPSRCSPAMPSARSRRWRQPARASPVRAPTSSRATSSRLSARTWRVSRRSVSSPAGSSTTNAALSGKRWFCQFGAVPFGQRMERIGLAGEPRVAARERAARPPGANERLGLVIPDRRVRADLLHELSRDAGLGLRTRGAGPSTRDPSAPRSESTPSRSCG